MAYKLHNDVVSTVEMKSDGKEWPWRVPAGTKGLVRYVGKEGTEVHFENGVVRMCKDNELALKGK